MYQRVKEQLTRTINDVKGLDNPFWNTIAYFHPTSEIGETEFTLGSRPVAIREFKHSYANMKIEIINLP